MRAIWAVILVGSVCISAGCSTIPESEDDQIEADDGFGGEDLRADAEGPPTGSACEVGDAGLRAVKIVDLATNESLEQCTAAPGADIDAVCVYRNAGDLLVGCAVVADYQPPANPPCANDQDDPIAALGLPSSVGDGGPDADYLSLNGGSIVFTFDYGVKILCRDQIFVFEVDADADRGKAKDRYSVDLGAVHDGEYRSIVKPIPSEGGGWWHYDALWEW